MINAVMERCAGIDIGKKFLAVRVMTGPASGEARSEICQFGTTVNELKNLPMVTASFIPPRAVRELRDLTCCNQGFSAKWSADAIRVSGNPRVR
jgi:hypothetical protein